jgi:hypothetical protein
MKEWDFHLAIAETEHISGSSLLPQLQLYHPLYHLYTSNSHKND